MSLNAIPKTFVVSTYMGQCAYTVKIDESEELSALIKEAEQLKELPFTEKLEAIQQLTIKAMANAWEGMQKDKDPTCTSIVLETHPLSDALKQRLGCCRYQSICFLILGAAANLGTKHYQQSTPINRDLQTCYNDVYDEKGTMHHVSIFAASLKDQQHSYIKNPGIFEKPNEVLRDQDFLAYEVDGNGVCTRYSRRGCHFDVDLEQRPEIAVQVKEAQRAKEEAERTQAASKAFGASLFDKLFAAQAQKK